MRGRRIWLALGVLLLLATGSASLVPLVRSATAGDPAPSTSAQLVACAEAGPGDGYCTRLVDDLARRQPLSDIDRATAGRFLERLREAFVARLGADCAAGLQFCHFREPPEVDELRQALAGAGLSGVVVRPARYTDPAPADAIVYAVRAGYACLVGWIDSGSGPTPQTAGRHKDGACLPP
jgi:hypothetical protein